jgi:hypothetical protein
MVSEAPYIGKINTILGMACGLLPIFSRWNQTFEIANENTQVHDQKWNYYARAVCKAVINFGMMGITSYTATNYGSKVASWFLISWCLSKLITFGDDAPISYLENLCMPGTSWSYMLLRSLASNMGSSLRSGFYGTVAIATFQNAIPLFGKLTFSTGTVFFLLPLFTRMHQIQSMSQDLNNEQLSYFYSKAFVDTFMDLGMGMVLFLASQAQDTTITTAFLIGWIGAKFTSGGDRSPLDHFRSMFICEKVRVASQRKAQMK